MIPIPYFNVLVYDQRSATLTVHISENVHPKFIPFYSPTIKSTLIFRLAQQTLDAQGNVLPPCDPEDPDAQGGRTRLYIAEHEKVMQPGEVLKVAIPFLGPAMWSFFQLLVTLSFVAWASILVPIAMLMPETVVKNGDHVLVRKKQ